ncbi:MAG: magnesium/cobalt transporter CorA, partial [Thermoplasmata archaeon]|nr:magnesium/cobalt transporter CorA [Thermoplasmata archaeon]
PVSRNSLCFPAAGGCLTRDRGIASKMIKAVVYDPQKGLEFPSAPPMLDKESERVVWIDIMAPAKEEFNILADKYNFHPLTIEDCMDDVHLPKIDDYDDYIFVILHRVVLDSTREGFSSDEIDFFVGKNFLVTVHKEEVKSALTVMAEIARNPKLISGGAVMLFQAIVDRLVDNYLPVLEMLEDRIDSVEEKILSGNEEESMDEILVLRSDLMTVVRLSAPQRDILNRLSRSRFEVITADALIYFRDTYDQLMGINDVANTCRDRIRGLLDVRMSITTTRLNEVIKVLTIIATIIMPLTLITGIYGMNFINMPETKSPYGYFIVMGAMFVIALAMIWYFRRRKWF